MRRCWMAVLHSRARRLICMSSEMISGMCSLLGSGVVGCCAMGQRDFASSWSVWMSMFMTCFAALSMCAGVVVGESNSSWRVLEATVWAYCVVMLPTW